MKVNYIYQPVREFYHQVNSKRPSKEYKSVMVNILVWFYGISAIVGYLMPDPFNIYLLHIYDLVRFGFMAYQPL